MKIHTYLGFRHGELATVVQSIMATSEAAIDCNYFIDDPQESEKQIAAWKKQHTP